MVNLQCKAKRIYDNTTSNWYRFEIFEMALFPIHFLLLLIGHGLITILIYKGLNLHWFDFLLPDLIRFLTPILQWLNFLIPEIFRINSREIFPSNHCAPGMIILEDWSTSEDDQRLLLTRNCDCATKMGFCSTNR